MFLLLALLGAPIAEPAADPVLELAAGEIQRVMTALKDADDAPYFLATSIVDTHLIRVGSVDGALDGTLDLRHRSADIDVRVGSMELDNTHKILDGSWLSEEGRSQATLPPDGDPKATLTILWRATDDAWQAAVRRYTRVQANAAVKVEREDKSPDFSPADPVVDVRAREELRVDVERWGASLKRVSAVFKEYPELIEGRADLSAEGELLIFVSSEGTRLQHPRVRYRVSMQAFTVAEDGARLDLYDYTDAHTPEGLPDEAALMVRARALAERLVAMRHAPVLEPYTGPALLRGRAAGVFFHEVFGHRIEGHRQKDEDEGQTFKDRLGLPILPDFLSVVDDPTVKRLAGLDLNGHYLFDDEGVAAQAVSLVEKGILRTFLMSRMPVEAVARSNGHGRRQAGNDVVARQGNLQVIAHRTVTEDALRKMLIEQVKAQGRPFGLIVDDITGGFTLTGRVIPNAFNVRPVAMWKVYPDGRPDELVRGGDLIGTPLTTFSRILAASDKVEVFNGVCGAESGWVPVSASSPSLLLQEIEVQRKEKENDRPPLLEAPR